MAEYGIWQGAERASGNVLATGMRLMEFNANRQDAGARRLLEQDRMEILRGQAKTDQALANVKLEEAAKQKEAYERPMNIKTQPHFLSLTPEGQQDALKFFSENNLTDAEGIGQSGKIMEGLGTIEKSKELFSKFMGPQVKAKEAGVIEAWTVYQEAAGSGDAKKAATAKALYDQKRLAYESSLGAFSKHLDELEKAQQAKELELLKHSGTTRQSVKDYVDAKGTVIPLDVNDPAQRNRIVTEGLTPYEKPGDKLPTEASLAEREAAGDPLAAEAGRILREGKRAGATKVSQSVSTGEGADLISKEAGKKYGSTIGDRAAKRDAGAEEGIAQNYQLDLIGTAIDQGARTGYGEETILSLRSAAQTFGINTGDLSGQEVIRKISNEMALRLRNPDSGLGLTGNTSNKDLDFLKASVTGLNRTEQGNRAIIASMKKYNQFKIALAQEQQRLIQQNKGGIPSDLDRKLLQFANSYQFFTPAERNQIKVVSGGKSKADVMKELKKANPSVSDSDLEAYAKKQGYIQ